MTEGAKRKSTMVELAAELRGIDYWSPGMQRLVTEAEAGEFHDYKNNKYACGKVEVVAQLETEASLPRTPRAAREKLRELRARVIEGEFDEEADEEDKEHLRKMVPRSAWPEFGL